MTNVPGFFALTDSDAKAKGVLEGSCVFSDAVSRLDLLAAWAASRQFIADAIDGPGTILDYGCANGYLLRCLQVWSPHALTPFGVDADDERLLEARRMFPGLAHHFVNNTKEDVAALAPHGFDYVYWAVGDNVDFTRPEQQRWFAEVDGLVSAGGRLILGFYDDDSSNSKKQRDLRSVGLEFDGTRSSSSGVETLVWMDRP